jgi:hypothetical protein
MKAFISYSHHDESALDRLHTHLAMLRREGRIVDWFDREILAGAVLDKEITEQLETCDLFLPLVSPDFLASNYCYETEMTRALERHDEGEVRVVPIIIEPCDWTASPLRKLKALPKDGKPIAEWTNQNTAFLDVVTELRRIVSEDQVESSSATPSPSEVPMPEDRRYRIKHDFDEIDRSDYREKAFEQIHKYFESAVAELNDVEGLRGRFSEIGPQSFTCTVVNRAMDRGTAHITVHASRGNAGMGDIYYSFTESAPANTSNGGFSVESDEYELFLQPRMFTASSDDERLTPNGAAELLWSEFIQQAGVSYD